MSIAQRSVRSSSYNITASILQTVVIFFRAVILARLLEPATFGSYKFLFAIVVWSGTLPNFGMVSALIHRVPESEGENALKVHFTLSTAFNLVWAIFLLLLSRFFIAQEFFLPFIVIVITQFFDNLGQTARAILIRSVRFRRLAILNFASTLVGSLVAVALAYYGFGIWSLVATDVAPAALTFLSFYFIAPVWRPKFGWLKETARYLLNFGSKTFLAGTLLSTLDHVDDVWTGIYLGETPLGFYSKAYQFATYPRNLLANPLNSVATGTYAQLKDDPHRLSQAFFRVNALLARSSFFLGGLIALIAPEFIRIVLGVKWLPMLDAFRLMLVYTLLDPMKITVANLFTSIGFPEKVVKARLIQLLVLLIGLITLGPSFGIVGVAVAVDFMLVAGMILLFLQARKYVRFSLVRLFLVPALALVVSMIFARLAIELPGIAGSPWRTGFVKTIVFTIIYALMLFSLERKELPMIFNMLRRLLPEGFIERFGLHIK